MNLHDRNNLKFILSANPATLKDWFERIEIDDRIYASELMATYKEELEFKSAMLDDAVESIEQAATYLQKFKLPL